MHTYIPRWRKLAARAQFRIQNFLCRPHSHPSHYSHYSHNRPCGSPLLEAVQKVFKRTTAAYPPFEGSRQAGAAEYVLRGDVYSHCRGDWQIALTKQNLSNNLFYFIQKSLTFCAFQRNISEFFLFRKWCIVAMQVLPTADNRFPIPP